MNKQSPIPVTLVSGFLGSGKTTLLNKILGSDHGLRMAVMVNDFGAINIDSELIVSQTQTTLSLANGCICCTVESDLIEQLGRLLGDRQNRPEYILIEASGVSSPRSSVAIVCARPTVSSAAIIRCGAVSGQDRARYSRIVISTMLGRSSTWTFLRRWCASIAFMSMPPSVAIPPCGKACILSRPVNRRCTPWWLASAIMIEPEGISRSNCASSWRARPRRYCRGGWY